MSQHRPITRWGLTICVAAWVSACGGGGGGSAPAGGPLLPAVSQDIVPAGAGTDVSARDYFILGPGNVWVYARRIANNPNAGVLTRRVEGLPDAAGYVVVSETDGTEVDTSRQRVTAQGLETLDPVGAQGVWPGVYAALPTFIDIPTPFYAAGGTRKVIRQGDIQADVDADGKNDYFRIEITQVFVGFESLSVLGQPTMVAHFRTTFAFTVAATASNASTTTVGVEDAYLADGLGLVKAERTGTAPDGSALFTPYTLDLVSATVNAQTYTVDGRSFELALNHRGVVFDAARGVFHVSVTAADPAHANQIATINPTTGAVSYSTPVGSGPGPLAVAADGSVLYVGLEGSGEVLKLALPSMTEVARVRMPSDPNFGQLLPEDISASPTSSAVFAVSLARTGVSPRHGGVALVVDMVVQPQRTQEHTGSNRIEFDASGGWVFGYNNETSEFGLRRIEVLSSGLVERQVVSTGGNFGPELRVFDGLATIDNKVFTADASLALLGTIVNGRDCVKLPAVPKLACQSALNFTRLSVVDAVTFTEVASPTFASSATTSEWRLIPGTAGQVAISEYGRIVIFSSSALR